MGSISTRRNELLFTNTFISLLCTNVKVWHRVPPFNTQYFKNLALINAEESILTKGSSAYTSLCEIQREAVNNKVIVVILTQLHAAVSYAEIINII